MTPLAGCIIFNTEKAILLIHRNKKGKQQWETPGGKVECGETPESAARRELREELGITVRIVRRIGEAIFFEKEKEYNYAWYEATFDQVDNGIVLENGFDDYGYFSLPEISEMDDLSAGTQRFIQVFGDTL